MHAYNIIIFTFLLSYLGSVYLGPFLVNTQLRKISTSFQLPTRCIFLLVYTFPSAYYILNTFLVCYSLLISLQSQKFLSQSAVALNLYLFLHSSLRFLSIYISFQKLLIFTCQMTLIVYCFLTCTATETTNNIYRNLSLLQYTVNCNVNQYFKQIYGTLVNAQENRKNTVQFTFHFFFVLICFMINLFSISEYFQDGETQFYRSQKNGFLLQNRQTNLDFLM